MRTGDTVRHIPTGELWTVAWADERELMWCGWPEGWAKISDCVLVKACTDEEHWGLVEELAKGGTVYRKQSCLRLLEEKRITECSEMMHL